ncbi:MAG: Cerebroside-sulfatase, partial [Lentisphaerae bacterium]
MKKRPNVILVLTDDQGYGDLGCCGNPWIQTPNIDRFARESVRCHDFHVSPLCTPTRGAIMSGRRPIRNGAWATAWGRSLLNLGELTLAEAFAYNDYRTGMFGKWHLGDNFPYRPQDRGFQHVVAHKGGGVGQTPDFWGNCYFNDTYFHNGTPQKHTGYCTDIWFDAAMEFIEANHQQPFFCYIATNAPHSPYFVEERYSAPYRSNPKIPNPEFYGMITNIDWNFGRLREHLQRLGIEDDTILIFMTDNGSSGGWDEQRGLGYNGGMRGKKGSFYDGGHRVPFFLRWANGELVDRDIYDLLDHTDLFPSFISLCQLSLPREVEFDGLDVSPTLSGKKQEELRERVCFVQNRQATEAPLKWHNLVMTPEWRLIHGKELYHIKTDPGQNRDLAAQYPEVVERLRQAHEAWWERVDPTGLT